MGVAGMQAVCVWVGGAVGGAWGGGGGAWELVSALHSTSYHDRVCALSDGDGRPLFEQGHEHPEAVHNGSRGYQGTTEASW